MNKWKKIRLELGQTEGFPSGSVSRGYLIQLPLDGKGRIDRVELALKPHRATVQRYWSTEPDQSGVVVPVEGGFGMRCIGSSTRKLLLSGQIVRSGEQLSVVETDGAVVPFLIASIR